MKNVKFLPLLIAFLLVLSCCLVCCTQAPTEQQLAESYENGYTAGYNYAKQLHNDNHGNLPSELQTSIPFDGDSQLQQKYEQGYVDGYALAVRQSTATVQLHAITQPVCLHTQEQSAYVHGDDYLVMPYGGTEDKNDPAPVLISWDFDRLNCTADSYTTYVSENSDMSNATSYRGALYDKTSKVYNLMPGKTYYYKVVAKCGSTKYESEVSSFTVKEEPFRLIKLDNIINCRDLGGLVTLDGNKVKYGMLFRSARWDGGCTPTPNDITTIKTTLGVKNEIDLRLTTEIPHTVGTCPITGITFKSFPMDSSNMTSATNLAQVKLLFDFMADENNYPMMFHCWIGTDRTGFVAFLVEGLLNVSYQDIYRDYLLSNFSEIGSARDSGTISNYFSKVGFYPDMDNDLQVKVYNYLHNTVGVSTENLDKIISILTVIEQ